MIEVAKKYTVPSEAVAQITKSAHVFLFCNVKELVDCLREISFTAHSSPELRVVDIPSVHGADLIPYFIKPVGEIFSEPVFKDLADRTVQSNNGHACV